MQLAGDHMSDTIPAHRAADQASSFARTVSPKMNELNAELVSVKFLQSRRGGCLDELDAAAEFAIGEKRMDDLALGW